MNTQTVVAQVSLCVVAMLMLFSLNVQAQAIYRTVGPDGKVTYGDKPSNDAKQDTVLKIRNAPASEFSEAAAKRQQELEASIGKRLKALDQAADSPTPWLFTASWCGYCKQAKAYLNQKHVAYQEYDIETQAGAAALNEAGIGKTPIPTLFWHHKKLVGFSKSGYEQMLAIPPSP